MLALASGLFSKFGGYLIAAIALIVVCFFVHHTVYESGYQDGEQKVQAAWDADKAKQDAVALAAASKAASETQANTQVAVTAQAKEVDDQATIQTQFKPIESKVTKYVQDHPASAAAVVLDADSLRIWNAANAGSDSSPEQSNGDDSIKPVGVVSGSITATQ